MGKIFRRCGRLLAKIAEARFNWVNSQPNIEIDRNIFLSDLRTAALVDNTGSINWLCLPKFDGIPIFGSLVGGVGAGYFRISGDGKAEQKYDNNSLIGVTKFSNITLTDFLDCSGGRAYQRAGRSDLVRVIEGSGKVSIEFAPKLNFGRIATSLKKVENGIIAESGEHKLLLYSPKIDWEIISSGLHDVAKAEIVLNDQRISLVFSIGTASAQAYLENTDLLLTNTKYFWEAWLATLSLPKLHTEHVSISALVLRGLCYGPTGAILAAGTCSLPEVLGGVRNWDYRYCWLRDACLSATALLKLGTAGPAY